MDARGRALISVGLSAATLLVPLVHVLPAHSGGRVQSPMLLTAAIFGSALRWGATSRAGDEPMRRLLPKLPKAALVALWCAPWLAFLGLIVFARQLDAATGVQAPAILLLSVPAIAWLALSIGMIALAVDDLRRALRLLAPEQA